jgi:lipopolysaccharide/colanic/teichoic acid biosynthesis glycosyltransferase
MSQQATAVAFKKHHSQFAKNIRPWCYSRGKRGFDITAAALILISVLPLMVLVALLIKLSSPGPVFFRQARVGRNGRRFRIFKFRSMRNGCGGVGMTCKGDSRVTAVGRFLRKSKIDELPQLLNVLKGEMSMVGPRPLIPEVFRLPPGCKGFTKLAPGLTGTASIKFCNEEDELSAVPLAEWRQYYIAKVLPEKVKLELEYASGRASLASDLALIFQTAGAILIAAQGRSRQTVRQQPDQPPVMEINRAA